MFHDIYDNVNAFKAQIGKVYVGLVLYEIKKRNCVANNSDMNSRFQLIIYLLPSPQPWFSKVCLVNLKAPRSTSLAQVLHSLRVKDSRRFLIRRKCEYKIS